jgi:phosphoglucosamine mutase
MATKLFGTDGVRGKAGKVLTADLVMRLAMAAGIVFRRHSKTNKILVGKDTRRSGYMIENALVAGFTAVGYDVVQIGPMPTPAVAFLTEDMRCDAGIMISASHNPYGDNGIKFFDHQGNKLSVSVEKEIESIVFDQEAIDEHQKTGMSIGSSKRIDDVIGRYIVHIKNSFPNELTLSGVRIVVDCANGAAYKVAPTILSELGAEVIVLSNTPNGQNINEQCGALHPENLASEVVRLRADIGFALDGDADRLVVVDDKGNIVHGDKLIAALSCYLKQKGDLSKNAVCATVMSNGAMATFLKEKGIALHRCDVGDKFVLETLSKEGLNFGGEQSGHIVFGDYAKTGDGLASALQTIALVLSSGKKASTVLNPFELYPQHQFALSVGHKPPLESIDGYNEIIAMIESKGLSHLIRYSGTENKLRILLEGADELLLESVMNEVVDFFRKKVGA